MLLLVILFFQGEVYSQQRDALKGAMYNLEGKIGSNIPAFLWFSVKDSIAVGEIKYTKVKSSMSIKVIGFITEEGDIKLNEFSNNGNVTGIFYGKMTMRNFSGTWLSPKTRKGLAFNFKNKDTLIKGVDAEIESKNFAGKYRYSYGKGGAEGNLLVSQINKSSSVTIKFSNYTDAPARNGAELKIEKLTLTRNEIVSKLEDANACVFRIRFFKDFAVVTYINNQRDCGFGNGAEIEGVYLKTN
jgi:hypothetical protein